MRNIEDIQKDLEEIENKRGELCVIYNNLEKERRDVIVAKIKEKSILKKGKWEVYSHNAKGSLICRDSSEIIQDISEYDYYSFEIQLTETVKLRNDDTDLFLFFKTNSEILPFIQEWGLIIDTEIMDNNLATTRIELNDKFKEFEDLEKLYAQLKG